MFKIVELFCSSKCITLAVLTAILLIGLSVGVLLGFKNTRKGAVVSNGWGCADIGGGILKAGGTAVDAAIATLLCEGVMLPLNLGVGGGFVAIIYTQHSKTIETIVARERAPAAATEKMFVGKKITGAISAGVPGELLGYWKMHKKYGSLPWKKLFEPTIKLCKEGILVSDFFEKRLKSLEEDIRREPTLSEIFLKEDGTLYKEGDFMKRPQLGKTLEIIAGKGIKKLYGGGELGKMFAEDVQKMGGIITEQDLKDYKVSWMKNDHTKAKIKNYYTLYTTPLPTSGPLLAFIINVMKDLHTSDEKIFWQRVIETFKHAYGRRSRLGDLEYETELRQFILETLNELKNENFVKQIRSQINDDQTSLNASFYGANFAVVSDKGSANIAVLAPNGDAITATSSISSFGAKVRSNRTGIILNGQMGEFSTPGTVNPYGVPSSPTNYIHPGKRPMSSMCPSIILDNDGNVRLLIGAAGGTKITTAVATAILKYIVLRRSIESAIDDPRLHHQLQPMEVDVELGVPIYIQNYLKSVGHKLQIVSEQNGLCAVTAIGFRYKKATAYYDRRRKGTVFHLR